MFCLFMAVGVQATTLCIALANEFPFSVGEKLTYELKWGLVPAGEASLEVLPNEIIDGVERRHFRMTTKSNSFDEKQFLC
ncbi:MAG: hypothetical protein JRJ14_10875 [Deltaproteobacteria bacterium]|nr:hypothetical protein [Deltaproteobacteria bacterium]